MHNRDSVMRIIRKGPEVGSHDGEWAAAGVHAQAAVTAGRPYAPGSDRARHSPASKCHYESLGDALGA